VLNNFNPVVISERNNPQGQLWQIDKLADGSVQFRLQFDLQKAIDIAYGDIKDEALICIYTYNDNDRAELFQLSVVL
jgi:hypothetical protein